MRRFILILFTIFLTVPAVVAEEGEKKDDDNEFWKNLKILGEYRLRFEAKEKFSGDSGLTQTLSRARLGISAKPSNNITAFLQFQDSRIFGEEVSTLASSDNVDLHQGWFEYRNIGNSNVSIKLGRQELIYGDQRLIGAVGWHNVGRSFDAAKVMIKQGNFKIDGFISTTHEAFSASEDAIFGGVYATVSKTPLGTIDAYALIKKDDRLIFTGELTREPGDLLVNTFGARIVGKPKDVPFSYGAEGVFQTGDFAEDSHEAWAFHVRGAFDAGTEMNLRLSAEYNFATGDEDPTDGKNETFDNLFPTNHNKYGYIDFIGWRNIKNIRIGASIMPIKGHTLAADYHFFNVATTGDNVYRATGAVLLFVPAGTDEDEIGQELDIIWRFSPAKGLGILAGYSHFFRGELFEITSGGAAVDDADFFYLQTLVKF